MREIAPTRELSYRQAITEALREEMLRDPRVFILGECLADPYGGLFRVTAGLSTEFGTDRVFDTPISESAIVGAAVGSALAGMRPIADIMYVDFATLAMDQIVNQAAKIRYMSGGQAKVPVVIRTQGGAGRSSGAQHNQSLEAWFVHVPGLKVVMPATPFDAKGLLKSSIRDDNPVVFIEHKLLYPTSGPVPDREYLVPIGAADIKREGGDVTIVAYSRMVLRALAAAERLAAMDISAEVVDLRTLVPLDEQTILESVRKTTRLVIVQEAVERGGFGAELAATVAAKALDYLDAPIVRVAAPNTPVPFAPAMENFHIPDETRIVGAVERLVKRRAMV